MTRNLQKTLQERLGDYSNDLRFWLNGEEIRIKDPDPTALLVNFIHERGMAGTKVGCEQGGCGACTVMISRRTEHGIDHKAINSCLRPLVGCADAEVTTIEGIGNLHQGLDPVQHRIAVYNGTQCGFCTPGFVMNMHAYLQKNPSPTQQQIEDIFGGNLCRCTGYRPILHGMKTFACDYNNAKDCTQPCALDPFFELKVREQPIKIDETKLPGPDQLQKLYFFNESVHWIRPRTLKEVKELKALIADQTSPDEVKLVVGNTASGIYPKEKPRYLIDTSLIPDLSEISETTEGIDCGAAVPIQDLMDLAESIIKKRAKSHDVSGLEQLIEHANHIAGIQVRNAGSVAGNIFITKSHTRIGMPFPSDLFTVLSALNTTVRIYSETYENKERQFYLPDMPISEQLPPDAILVGFHIPFARKNEYIQTYRVARRPQMSHAIVNGGLRCVLDADNTIEEIAIVVGGIETCNGRLVETERFLRGKPLNDETLAAALTELKLEVGRIIVSMDEEGFTNEYRASLVESFLYKFFLYMEKRIEPSRVSLKVASAAEKPVRPLSHGTQTYDVDDSMLPLTSPIARRTAISQATGEVRYVHDEPLPPGGYHAIVVLSSRPHARFEFRGELKGTEEILRREFPGVVGLVTVADIPKNGTNIIGLFKDDPIFADREVINVGQAICLVLADKRLTAEKAAAYVASECISYEDLPAVVSFEEAIAKQHVMPMAFDKAPDPNLKVIDITRPGSDAAWVQQPKAKMNGGTTLSGTMKTHAQAHFYMETCVALAYPGSYDEMTIHSSTQNPNGDQAQIARALGIKANQVTVKVEQLGGGFGGKQNRAVFVGAMAALACKKMRRPVMLKLSRETDMQLIGKRHPHWSDYHVSYQDDGTIQGMVLDLRTDGGSTIDCSLAVMKGGVMMSDGCYNVPSFRASGVVYKTNKQSNSAMRTFGQVQPHLLLEDAIEHVAFDLSKRTGRKVRAEEIRRQNMYRSSEYETADATHFGQPLWFCDLREQWDTFYKSAEFEQRMHKVEEFNATNRWRKRGISMVPVKYGIGFKQLAAMNTSTALVHINKEDGSVTAIHGGVEMGQGLHTKIAQVVANELNVPLAFVRVVRNNTDIIVNAPATAASTGFDLNGGAVALACRTLKKRLDEVCDDLRRRKPELGDLRLQWREKWPTIVQHAYTQRVNLHATELYRAPHYDTPVDHYEKGKFFAYFTYSFSISEVEVDVLTGEVTVLRADLLYDAGKSLNPAIDIGQIEGGYVQGLGFVTTEESIFDHDGRLVTDNIWSYKPPCSKTIPIDMRVSMVPRDAASCFRQEQAGLLAVKGSKSTCEPTLSLGNSVFFAIKQAIQSARKEQTGEEEWVELPAPLTCQRIRMACAVDPEKMRMKMSDRELAASPRSAES